MNERLRRLAIQLVPHGIVAARHRSKIEAARRHERDTRHERLAAAEGVTRGESPAFSYEDAVAFLVGRGIPERHVREGSIPEAALARVVQVAAERLPTDRALVGLHVGNFLGLSLSFVTDALRGLHPESLVVSIDPGLPHRGVERPHEHALAVLQRYGLAGASVVVLGYSLAANVGDDGIRYEGSSEKLLENLASTDACERVLRSLRAAAPGSIDLALLDGNHAGDYLREEVALVEDLLRPGGLLVLDDVTPGTFDELREVLDELAADTARFTVAHSDDRIAILARR